MSAAAEGAGMTHSRRKFERHALVRFVWYKSLAPDGLSVEGIGYLVDVSRGGLGLMAKHPLAKDELLFVKVVFEGLKHNLAAVCRVAFCRNTEEGNHLGLEFVALPPDSREFIMMNFG
jgi:hypothetical protein